MPQRLIPFDGCLSEGRGFVGRVVENLDLQLLPRIFKSAAGLDQPLDDELLVVNGQLHRDGG